MSTPPPSAPQAERPFVKCDHCGKKYTRTELQAKLATTLNRTCCGDYLTTRIEGGDAKCAAPVTTQTEPSPDISVVPSTQSASNAEQSSDPTVSAAPQAEGGALLPTPLTELRRLEKLIKSCPYITPFLQAQAGIWIRDNAAALLDAHTAPERQSTTLKHRLAQSDEFRERLRMKLERMRNGRDEAPARCEELEVDKARLDWLEKVYLQSEWNYIFCAAVSSKEGIRATIDKARAVAGDKKEEGL